MAEVRRRTVTATTGTVKRRRDRVKPVEEDETEDVDLTERPARTRRPAPTHRVVTRRPRDEEEEPEDDDDDLDLEEEEDEPAPPRRRARARVEPEEDDEEPEDDDDDDDQEPEDEEEEEPAPPPRRRRAAGASARPARKLRAVPDDDDDDDEPAPRRGRSEGRRVPPGLRVGIEGAEQTAAAGAGSANRLTVLKEPELVKFLENGPFVSYRQHWVRQGGAGQNDRPYVCPGRDCPLCKVDPQTTATYMYNVLHLSDPEGPSVKVWQHGIRADRALKDIATDKLTEKFRPTKNFISIKKSGTGTQAQTNFSVVKQRDIREDWPEIRQYFDLADLDAIIEEAKDDLFDLSIVQIAPMRTLAEVANYLANDD